MNLSIVCVVWGREFTRVFTDIVIPNHLTLGNIPALAKFGNVNYKLYTTIEDIDQIKRSNSFKNLCNVVSVELLIIPSNNPDVITRMHSAHTHFLKTFGRNDSKLMFLAPDLLFSEGSLEYALEVSKRAQAVEVCPPHISLEDAIPAVQEASCRFSGRELVKLCLKHWHPFCKSLWWDDGRFCSWPPQLYWKVADHGFIAHVLTAHNLIIAPREGVCVSGGTYDYTMVSQLYPNFEDSELLCDSDRFCMVEMTRKKENHWRPPPALNLPDVITGDITTYVSSFQKKYFSDQHRNNFQQTIRFHSADIDTEVWAPAEYRANAVVSDICDLPDASKKINYSSRIRYVAINICWGQDYTKLFAEYSLPSTLSLGNFPYLSTHGDALYRLYTTKEDLAYLNGTSSFKLLKEMMPVDIKLIQNVIDKYNTMKKLHQEAIREFTDGKNRMIFLSPDNIVSDGSMRRVVVSAENGFRALRIFTLQTYNFTEFLKQYGNTSAVWKVSPRDMVMWALKDSDGYAAENVWRSSGVVEFPAIPGWRVGNTGLVCHLLLPHPMMAWPRAGTPAPDNVIDFYIPLVCQDTSECDLVTDSDELSTLGLRHQRMTGFRDGEDPIKYTRGIVRQFAPIFLDCFRRTIRLHAKDLDSSWEFVEEEASTVMSKILE